MLGRPAGGWLNYPGVREDSLEEVMSKLSLNEANGSNIPAMESSRYRGWGCGRGVEKGLSRNDRSLQLESRV